MELRSGKRDRTANRFGRGMRVGLALVIISSFLTACSKPSNQQANSGSTSNANTNANATAGGSGDWAKKPVTFVWADNGEPSTIDPAVVQGTPDFVVPRNVYEPLVEIDPAKLELIPRLALSWTVKDTTYTFKLRPNVKFHDGTPFNADAVKFTIERMQKINQGTAYLINNVTAVTAKDELTVEITTAKPDPYLPGHLVKVGIISPKAAKDNAGSDGLAKDFFSKNAVGTGPYKFERWDRGSQIALVKNEEWWNGWQEGSIDRIIFKGVTEVATRMQMLQRGQANLVGWAPVNETVNAAKQPGFKQVSWNTYDTDPAIFMNVTKPPLDNKLVRQALQYAFDYEAMLKFNQGNATIPTGPIPADYEGGAKDFAPFKQDLEKAKALLAEAKVDPSKVTLDFAVPVGIASFDFAGTVFADSVKKLGMTVNINRVQWPQMIEMYKKPETSPHITDFAQSPFGLDPTLFLYNFYYTGAVYNMSKYSKPEVDQMIDKAKITIDPTERNKILYDVQKLIRDDAPVIWTVRPKTLDAVPDKVSGYVMDPTDYRWVTKFYLIRMKQ